MEIRELPNIGILINKLPSELFEEISYESQDLESKNEIFITGLTSNGVARQFRMQETYKKKLLPYLDLQVNKFLESYPSFLNDYNILSKNCRLEYGDTWYNIQRKGEFLPLHTHDGVLSYNIWVKIPYDIKEEIKNSVYSYAGTFAYTYPNILGIYKSFAINIDKSFEGVLFLFPSKLSHIVYPFFTSDDKRISLAGNISFSV